MQKNAARPFRFFLERLIQKGIFGQLLLMASLVVLVAVLGGLVAWIATPQFENAPTAIWWAFLRLTDPGYLGDDEGAVLRTISTVITILGYVLFMGSMIAIMTQWLSRTMKSLESGVTPIAMRDHAVILGWTNRTPEIVLKLLGARGRLQRFLAHSDSRKLRVVVLAEDASSERREELREYLGEHWSESQIFLRAGSSLQLEHLDRLDLLRASVVVVPGADFELGGSDMTDTRVIKTLMTVNVLFARSAGRVRPRLVAEIFDPHKVPIARNTIENKLEVVASNRIISRLISQSVRHRGLSQILFGLFSHRQGNSLFLRNVPELAGHAFADLTGVFQEAVVLGFLRKMEGRDMVIMDPGAAEVLGSDDLLIFLAQTYDSCQPSQKPTAAPQVNKQVHAHVPKEAAHKILILGWSHKIVALISELGQSVSGTFDITIMSRMSIKNRDRWLGRIEFDEERVHAKNVHGDYSVQPDLFSVHPNKFDHIVFLASEWMDSSEQADARTILGHALLSTMFKGVEKSPEVLVELIDPDSSSLFETAKDVVLVTPRILSHLLAHVALRAELNSVFEELFGAGGSEIDLRSPEVLHLVGREVSFRQIQEAALKHGLVAMGVLRSERGSQDIQLNHDRNQVWNLTESDSIIVLGTQPSRDR